MLEIENLSWKLPEASQKRAVAEWSEFGELEALFAGLLDSGRKDVWTNASLVLHSKADLEVARVARESLRWYMDPNWPGFFEIDKRLKSLKPHLIDDDVARSKELAHAKGDEEWLSNLRKSFPD